MGRPLTKKQQAFADNYIKTDNATQSYKDAGYSWSSENVAESGGSRLLRNVKVKKYISDRVKKIQQKQEQKTIMSQEEVLARLSLIASGQLKETRVTFDKVQHEDLIEVSTGDKVVGTFTRNLPMEYQESVKTNEQVRALEIMAKHYGLLDGDKGDGETRTVVSITNNLRDTHERD